MAIPPLPPVRRYWPGTVGLHTPGMLPGAGIAYLHPGNELGTIHGPRQLLDVIRPQNIGASGPLAAAIISMTPPPKVTLHETLPPV